MTVELRAPETDLMWLDPTEHAGTYRIHTTHTHYFGFHIPEAEIGCYTYIRYLPYFPLMQGNVEIFQGTGNTQLLDCLHLDYAMSLPWPKVEGNVITTCRGFKVEFIEPGREARVTYRSLDGSVSFELHQTAISPLIARATVMPGENLFGDMQPGGSEQFMHCVGELKVRGKTYAIDCYPVRDRSWNQDRCEDQGGRVDLPLSWTPAYFDQDLYFGQAGYETLDTDPSWKGKIAPPPDDYPGFLYAFIGRGGELRGVERVRREVTELHPTLHCPTRQIIEAVDDQGESFRMEGQAIAVAPLVAWPNAMAYESVYRWVSDDGRVAHSSCQGIWYDAYQKAMKDKGVAVA